MEQRKEWKEREGKRGGRVGATWDQGKLLPDAERGSTSGSQLTQSAAVWAKNRGQAVGISDRQLQISDR